MLNIVKKHLMDLEAGKWTEYKAALAADVVYDEMPTRVYAKGADEYVKAIQRWKTAFPDLHAQNLKFYPAGEYVFCELEWVGTHQGTFDGPFGSIAATLKKGSVKAALIFSFRNDKIVEVKHYFDLMTVLTQLGIMTSIGPNAMPPRVGATPPVRH